MLVTFTNLNNNDTEHEIIFKNITCYAGDFAIITVLFDGVMKTVTFILGTVEKTMVLVILLKRDRKRIGRVQIPSHAIGHKP